MSDTRLRDLQRRYRQADPGTRTALLPELLQLKVRASGLAKVRKTQASKIWNTLYPKLYDKVPLLTEYRKGKRWRKRGNLWLRNFFYTELFDDPISTTDHSISEEVPVRYLVAVLFKPKTAEIAFATAFEIPMECGPSWEGDMTTFEQYMKASETNESDWATVSYQIIATGSFKTENWKELISHLSAQQVRAIYNTIRHAR